MGHIDLLDKIVYVGTILPSPKDSTEWPTVYIRGIKDLRKNVELIKRETNHYLIYVGEWHSHPGAFRAFPSEDDIKAHRQLSDEMRKQGYPGVILIQGGRGYPSVLLDHYC